MAKVLDAPLAIVLNHLTPHSKRRNPMAMPPEEKFVFDLEGYLQTRRVLEYRLSKGR